jgi:hypothetical protein
MSLEALTYLDDIVAAAPGSSVKDATESGYRSMFACYRRFCYSCKVPALPFRYAPAAKFVVYYMLIRHGYNSRNPTASLGNIKSALKFVAEVDGLDWMSKADDKRLGRLIKGLKSFFPQVVKRAAPLTLQILCTVVETLEQRGELKEALLGTIASKADARQPGSGKEQARKVLMQWKARAFMAHSAMLRADDHSVRHRRAWRTMTKSCVQWRSDMVILFVPPGKTNSDFEPTFHAVRQDPACAGMHFWVYWVAFDFDNQPESALLWPLIVGGNIIWARPAQVKAFVALTEQLLVAAGFPQWFVDLVTGHSFRCGGCTDLMAAGAPDSFIKLQGRWRSDAYRIYLRHSYAYGRQVSGRIFSSLRHAWKKTNMYEKYVALGSHYEDDDGL